MTTRSSKPADLSVPVTWVTGRLFDFCLVFTLVGLFPLYLGREGPDIRRTWSTSKLYGQNLNGFRSSVRTSAF